MKSLLILSAGIVACGAAPVTPPVSAPGTPAVAPAPPESDRDADSNLDTEPAWTGRKVAFGQDFVLSRGEEVSFGDHQPVIGWSDGGVRDLVVSVVIQRIPPDALPGGLRLMPGEPARVEPCTLLLVRLEPGEPPKAVLRVTCGVP